MFIIHPVKFIESPAITETIDSVYLTDSSLINFFDKDGYEITELEHKYYTAQGFTVSKYTAGHPGLFSPWIELEHPKLNVDHSCGIQRCNFSGKSLEQLKKYRPINYRLGWLMDVKAKWGLDFNLDYNDESRAFEVIHLEMDSFNIEDILEQQYKIEQFLKEKDWEAAAEAIWDHKDQWQHLKGWYAQQHWKARYFGLERAWY
jgi:hypothetical protein